MGPICHGDGLESQISQLDVLARFGTRGNSLYDGCFHTCLSFGRCEILANWYQLIPIWCVLAETRDKLDHGRIFSPVSVTGLCWRDAHHGWSRNHGHITANYRPRLIRRYAYSTHNDCVEEPPKVPPSTWPDLYISCQSCHPPPSILIW